MINVLTRMATVSLAMVLVGCAAPQADVDYSAFRESKPTSILVLPPLNESVDVTATMAVLSQATLPLAESGYYVMPVAVMEETFRQNGLVTPEDIHDVPASKLHEIFGADTALYMTVKEYGSQYVVFASTVTVSIEAALVDLRTGNKLWNGQKLVSYAGGSGGGILGMMIQAVVDQVVNTLSDRGYQVAGMTNQVLLSAGQPGGILYGPRSPHYEAQ